MRDSFELEFKRPSRDFILAFHQIVSGPDDFQIMSVFVPKRTQSVWQIYVVQGVCKGFDIVGNSERE